MHLETSTAAHLQEGIAPEIRRLPRGRRTSQTEIKRADGTESKSLGTPKAKALLFPHCLEQKQPRTCNQSTFHTTHTCGLNK